MRRLTGLLCALLFIAVPNGVLASNARDYIPLPAGTKLVNLYYDMSFGDELYQDSDKVTSGMDMDINLGVLRPIYYTEIGGMIVAPQFILPFGKAGLNGEQSSGLSDLLLACAIFPINDMQNKFFLAYMPFLTVPIGEYDRDKLVNLGNNRWATKHELAVGKGFGEKVWLEWVSSVEFFFDNDDAGARSVDLARDELYKSELHLSYSFTKRFFASVDYYFAYGGETELDGVSQDDKLRTHTMGMSCFFMLNDNTQAMVDFRRDLDVRCGIKTSEITFRLAYLF